MRAAIGVFALFVAAAAATTADDDAVAPQEDLVPPPTPLPPTPPPTVVTGSPTAADVVVVIAKPVAEPVKEAVQATGSPTTAAVPAEFSGMDAATAVALKAAICGSEKSKEECDKAMKAFSAATCGDVSGEACAELLKDAIATYCPAYAASPSESAMAMCMGSITNANALRDLMVLTAEQQAERVANGIGCTDVGAAVDLLCNPEAPIPLIVPCDTVQGCSYCSGSTVESASGVACSASTDGRKFAGLSAAVASEVNVTMNSTWTVSVPEGGNPWKLAYRNRMAEVHGLGNETVRDLFMPLAKGSRDMVKLWNADAATKSAMTSYTICNPPNYCGGSDDDELPGWAIALCVVLPVLACVAIGGGVYAYTSKKDGEEEEENQDGEGEHNPDAGDEAEKVETTVVKTETDAQGNTTTEVTQETK